MVVADRLPRYLRERPLPIYPWLRQITWERIVDLHNHHVKRQKRTVEREQPKGLPDESATLLASRLIDKRSTPSQHMMRQEMQDRVRAALDSLDPQDHEILVMRHLEQMKVREIAAVLGISESAVKMRRLRAVSRLLEVLEDESEVR